MAGRSSIGEEQVDMKFPASGIRTRMGRILKY
jgi:hypothetical protein